MSDAATLERFFDALNAHDIDRILSHFAPDGAFITGFGPPPGESRHQGHDALRRAFERAFLRMPAVGWFEATHLPSGRG